MSEQRCQRNPRRALTPSTKSLRCPAWGLTPVVLGLALLGGLLLGLTPRAEAFTCTSVSGSGLSWAATSTWTGSCNSTIPQSADAVVIAQSSTVNFDAASPMTIASLTFNAPSGGASVNTLTHTTANLLTITGNVTMNQPGKNSITQSWNINAGQARVNGTVTLTAVSTTASRVSQITLTTGT